MNGSDERKEFSDPLMDRGAAKPKRRRRPAGRAAAPVERPAPANNNAFKIIGIVLLVAALAALTYFHFQSQEQIKALSTELIDNQQKLEQVNDQLGESNQKIGSLEQGLDQSEQQLGQQKAQIGRYQSLYSNLKEEQTEQEKELQAIAIKKADQEVVDAAVNEIKADQEGLQSEVGEMGTRLSQTNSNVSDLREKTTKNRADLDANSTSLTALGEKAEANAQEISGVKRSLDRDYFNFEIQKGKGVMKVSEVALSLRNTDQKNQRFHIEIVTNGKTIGKKRWNVNEPIFFYVEGVKKPYEVLVNRVGKNFVTGYVSVPKG